jgi:hypothetical protein
MLGRETKMTPVSWIGIGASLMLMAALYFTGNAYLDKRDEVTLLNHEQIVGEIKREAKEDKEQAVADIREEYDGIIATNTTSNQETVNDLTTQLMSAREDARNDPILFGDELVRNLIYTDCMWSLSVDSLQGRDACNREAANADPTSTNLYYTTITAEFLTRWGDACSDWGNLGITTDVKFDEERAEWVAEYDNFDVAMCNDTLVAWSPEASKFIEILTNKGTDYITRLRTHGHEQEDIIKQLLERYDEPEKTTQ